VRPHDVVDQPARGPSLRQSRAPHPTWIRRVLRHSTHELSRQTWTSWSSRSGQSSTRRRAHQAFGIPDRVDQYRNILRIFCVRGSPTSRARLQPDFRSVPPTLSALLCHSSPLTEVLCWLTNGTRPSGRVHRTWSAYEEHLHQIPMLLDERSRVVIMHGMPTAPFQRLRCRSQHVRPEPLSPQSTGVNKSSRTFCPIHRRVARWNRTPIIPMIGRVRLSIRTA